MMWKIFITIFISFFGICGSINEEEVSKVTCALSRLNYADIVKKMPIHPIKLSKTLFKECCIKVRIVSNVRDIGKNQFILFASHERDNQETF